MTTDDPEGESLNELSNIPLLLKHKGWSELCHLLQKERDACVLALCSNLIVDEASKAEANKDVGRIQMLDSILATPERLLKNHAAQHQRNLNHANQNLL